MNTIIFQGTEEQISKVQLNSYAFPTEELPKLVEIRVYVLETSKYDQALLWKNKMFMRIAEEDGRVYTLEGFQRAFNEEEINTSIDVIRFIPVPFFGL